MKLRAVALALLVLVVSGFSVEPAAKGVRPVPPSAAVPERDYCRYIGDDFRGKLETVIVTMKNKAGVSVELVGAVHIADAAYYEALNELFKGYDALLFELVDGQSLKEDLEGTPPPKKKTRAGSPTPAPEAAGKEAGKDDGKQGDAGDGDEAHGKFPTRTPRIRKDNEGPAFVILRTMMMGIGSYFHLEYQTVGINYFAKNFVHADVSMDEFLRLQAEKGESWSKLFQKSIEAQLNRGPNKDEEPKGSALLLALLGDSSGIKITMARMLGQLESNAEEIGFGADSVIVGERNRVALEVFDRELKAGRKNMGIFYGAAHLPDMEKRLETRGFHRTAERWMTAWDIKPKVEEKK